MQMRKFTAAVVGSVLALTGITSVHASIPSVGDPGQSWAVPDDAKLGQHIMEFLDTFPGEQPSYLINPNTPSVNGQGGDYLEDPTCTSAKDPRCIGKQLRYQAVLPHCTSDTDVNCVVDFGSIDSNGVRQSATFSRYFPSKAINEYQGDPSLHLPSGVGGSLYSLPNSSHDGGDQYYVAVNLRSQGSSTSGFSLGHFQARIYPVQLQPVSIAGGMNSAVDSGFSLNNRGRTDGTSFWGQAAPGFGGSQFCVAESSVEQKCAARFAFPANTKFFLKVRLQYLPTGWMHGRISDPTLSIVKGNGFSDLDIVANPVAVPAVYKMYNWIEMPPSLQANYDLKTGLYNKDPGFIQNPLQAGAGGRSAPNSDPLKRNVIISPNAWDASGMEQLKLWLPYVNDQATALLSYWSVRSLSDQELQGSNNCFNDPNSVTGIVTTNATQYSAGPPVFDKSQGALNYSVAAPHYTTTHDVFQGTYDLIMRSDVARCVYGFNKAPIKATISVTSADGSPQTATTVLSETNGWVHLAANGFQFSNPSIQVKLLQDAPAPAPTVSSSPAPSATPTPVTSIPLQTVVAKKTTITCIKGKLTKSVTAVKPTCPTGYRKK